MRLHRSMVLIRIGVDRLDLLRGIGEGALDIACLIADECLLRVEPGFEHFGDRGAGDFRVRLPRPRTIGKASSAVLACHQVSAITATPESPTCTTFLHALHPRDFGGVEALHLAAEHRDTP